MSVYVDLCGCVYIQLLLLSTEQMNNRKVFHGKLPSTASNGLISNGA